VRAIRLLNFRHVRRQPLRTTLAVVAIAAGTALATAVVIESQSFSASITGFARRLGGPTPLRIVGADTHGGIDQAVVAKAAAVPGVAAAVPVVQAVTYAEGADGTKVAVVALGIDCSVQAIVGDVGCSSAAVTAASDTLLPLVSPSLVRILGPHAAVRHDLGRLSLDGATPVAALDQLNDGRVVVFPLPEAQRLFMRPGRLDVIYIRPTPGTRLAALRARLIGAIGSWNGVLRASDPPPGAGQALFLLPELGVVALMALLVGALLIYNLVSLALAERRRDLAIAGALGATDRLIWVGAAAEAGALGLAGGLVGIAGGVAVAHPLVAALSAQAGLLGGIHVGVHLSPWIAVIGAGLGAAVGALAAVIPARRATRTDLAAELQQRGSVTDTSAPVRLRSAALILGIGFLGVAGAGLAHSHGATSRWQPPLGTVSALVATVAFFASVGTLTPLVIRLAHRLTRDRAGAVPLALGNLLRESRRTGVVALAVGIAVGMSTQLASAIPAIHAVGTRYAAAATAGRVSVSTLDPNNTGSIDAKVSPAVQSALLRIPGVGAVDRSAFLQVGHSASQLVAINGFDHNANSYKVYDGHATPSALAGGEVFIGPGLARDRGLHAGSVLRLDTPTGVSSLRVAAVWEDPNNNGHGVTMSRARLQQLFGIQPPFSLLVRPAAGVSVETLAARISAAHLDPDLQVLGPDQFVSKVVRSITGQLAPFWAMQRTLLLVTFIATLSTLLLVGIQRRRELGALAAVGMGPHDLARMTLVEAGIIGLVGSVLALVLTLGPLVALLWWALFFSGSDAPFNYSVGPALAYAGVAAVVVLAGAAWPAWRTSRLEVVDALRYE
jgi:putative ABC transport system permease protein